MARMVGSIARCELVAPLAAAARRWQWRERQTIAALIMSGPTISNSVGRTVLIPIDSSVGYEPPNAAPNDDGINFLGSIHASEVVLEPATFLSQADQVAQVMTMAAPFMNPGNAGTRTAGASEFPTVSEKGAAALQARHDFWATELDNIRDTMTFKLANLKREFATDYQIQVTDLKIPTGYDLEAT